MFLNMKYQMMINGSIGSNIPMRRSIKPSLLAMPPKVISELARRSIRNGSVSRTTLLMLLDLRDLLVRIIPLMMGRLSGLTSDSLSL